MRALALVFTLLCTVAAPARAQKPGGAGPAANGLKGRTFPGFTLKKTSTAGNATVELWERAADGAQLRIEIVPGAGDALVETRLKAVNAKIPTSGVQSEQLMFRFQTTPGNKAWTNYRATHHITFKTYRFWRLQDRLLVMADVSFPKGKPSFDAARGAFVTARKAADSTVRAAGGA